MNWWEWILIAVLVGSEAFCLVMIALCLLRARRPEAGLIPQVDSDANERERWVAQFPDWMCYAYLPLLHSTPPAAPWDRTVVLNQLGKPPQTRYIDSGPAPVGYITAGELVVSPEQAVAIRQFADGGLYPTGLPPYTPQGHSVDYCTCQACKLARREHYGRTARG